MKNKEKTTSNSTLNTQEAYNAMKENKFCKDRGSSIVYRLNNGILEKESVIGNNKWNRSQMNFGDIMGIEWELVEEPKKTLSDKIIRVVPTSLEYPDDGRRMCELSSISELLCKRIQENKRAYAIDLIELEDVKEHLKEFIEGLKQEIISRETEHNKANISLLSDSIDNIANEIFGKRLIE